MLTFQQAKDPDYMESRTRSLMESLVNRQILSLVVEAASSCNLRCTFCDPHSGRAPKFREQAGVMKEETWLKVLDDIRAYVAARGQLAMIQFHGGGEPLLNKRLPAMIEQVKREGLAKTTRIITNLVRRAFRRPVAAGEASKYVSLAQRAAKDEGSFEEGLAVGIEALLV